MNKTAQIHRHNQHPHSGMDEFTFSKFFSFRQSRSAESSPILFRRRLKASNLFNCAGSSHSSGSTSSKMPEHEDRQTDSPSPPYSAGPTSPTPLSPTTSTSSSTKRQKIWKNIKRFQLRSRASSHAQLNNSNSKNVRSSSVEVLNYNGRSDSLASLTNNTSPSIIGKFWISGKSPKKSIIRNESTEQQNIVKHLGLTNRQVEFASSDEVFPLSEELEEAGASDMLANSPPMVEVRSNRRVTRQSTVESINSTVAELLRQDTGSRTSSFDAPEGVSGYASFLLKIHLREGRDLVIRDASGSSDPYVKFKYKGKTIYKSNTIFKNLNPQWDEHISHLIDDPTSQLNVEVYDYDRFALDDFMGSTTVELAQFLPNQTLDLKLILSNTNSDQYMGYLLMQISLTPLTKEEQIQFVKKNVRTSPDGGSTKKTAKTSQVWSSVVNIVLVEAKNLLPTDTQSQASLPDPYVRFKLGSDKYKSKAVLKTLEPKWLEQFDMHMYDDQSQTLEVMVFDRRKDLFMGRCTVNLSQLEREKTHHKWHELEDGAGQIFFLVSISGTLSSATVSDLKSVDSKPVDRQALIDRYALKSTLKNLRDVGHVTVRVYRAQGLASADIGGKSDPFCVLELVNARLQTHTEYKTLSPEWNKIFTFNVKDVNSVLEITVYDEDPNRKFEFLGKLAIPLLKMKNNEKKWYALKDRKLQRRAKGQILLEFELYWNAVRASVRTVNPKENKFIVQEPKFKRQVFIRNVMRVKGFIMAIMEIGAFIGSCFSWESPARSLIAFIAFLVVTFFAEVYMLPFVLLLLFIRGYTYRTVSDGMRLKNANSEEYIESDMDDDDITDEKLILFDFTTAIAEESDLLNGLLHMFKQKSLVAEEKRGIRERLLAVQDTLAMVQNALDFIASSLERVKNTFNFTTPFLSYFAILILCLGTFVLYFLPIRWLVMAWGINKFTKKLRSPHTVPNNELLDFLSRVPSDDEIRQYGEFRPEPLGSMTNVSSHQTKRKKVP